MWKLILNRFMNLFKSKALSALDAIENPVEVYELAVRESEENIRNMSKAIATALADQKTREKELQQALLEAESWQQKARVALSQGHEDLARTALEHKGISQKMAEEYAALNEMLKRKIEEQKKQLQKFKVKHEELKAKKSIYTAKYETAKAQKKMTESMGGLHPSALGEVRRLEEKINKMESESEAMYELTQSDNEVRDQFNALEINVQMEDDMEKLKQEIEGEKERKKIDKMKAIEEQLGGMPALPPKSKMLDEFYSLKKNRPESPHDSKDKKGNMDDFFKKN